MRKKLLVVLSVCSLLTAGYAADYSLSVGEVMAGGSAGGGSHAAITDPCEGVVVSGKGSDIWGNNDAGYFLHTPDLITGNFDATCRVTEFLPSPADTRYLDEWGKGGIMARTANINDGANHFIAISTRATNEGVKNQRRLTHQYREAVAGTSASSHNYPFATPIYLRLMRAGSTFYSFYKYNEDDPWTQWVTRNSGTSTVATAALYLGIAVTNHRTDQAAFDMTVCGWNVVNTGSALAVANLRVVAEPTGVRLVWGTIVPSGEAIDHFILRRRDASGWTTLTSSLAADQLTYLDTAPIANPIIHPTNYAPYVVYAITPVTTTGLHGLAAFHNFFPDQITESGFVTAWIVSPNYSYTPLSGTTAIPSEADMYADYLAEAPGEGQKTEANILPVHGMVVNTQFGGAARSTGAVCNVSASAPNQGCVPTPPTWTLATTGSSAVINFSNLYTDLNNCVTYAVTYLTNTTESPLLARIDVSSDDSSLVMLDNTVWHAYQGCCATQGEMVIPPGEHRLMVKIFEGTGGHNVALRIRDSWTQMMYPPGVLTVSAYPETMTSVPAALSPAAPGMSRAGQVQDWLTLALYDSDTAGQMSVANMKLDYLMEAAGETQKTEANIIPVAGMVVNTDYTLAASKACFQHATPHPGATCPPTWLYDRLLEGRVNFNRLYNNNAGNRGDNMGYGVTYVTNRTANVLPVLMRTASDDSILVMVDNVVWHANSAARGYNVSQDQVPMVLYPGEHRIMMKGFNSTGTSGNGHDGGLSFINLLTGMPFENGELSASAMPTMPIVPFPPTFTAVRTIAGPCSVTLNTTLTVTIALNPAGTAMDVYEGLLPPWGTPTAIDKGGVWDPASRVIFWNDVTDSVSYQVALTAAPAFGHAFNIVGFLADPTAGLVKIEGASAVTVAEQVGDWNAADIGGPALPGTHDLSGIDQGLMEVAGGGNDIWGQWDRFHFVFKQFTEENFYFMAQIEALPAPGYVYPSTSDAWIKAGIMLRDSCAANSAYATAQWRSGYQGGNFPGYLMAVRDANNVNSRDTGLVSATNLFPQLGLVLKTGSQVSVLFSRNQGVTWESRGTMTLPDQDGGASYLAGLYITAHNNGFVTGATFSSIDYGTIPPCPSNLAAVKSGAAIAVSWTLNGDYTRFRLERKAALTNQWVVLEESLAGANAEYVDTTFDAAAPALYYRLTPFIGDDGNVPLCTLLAGYTAPGYVVYQEGILPTPAYTDTSDTHIITYLKDNNQGGHYYIEEGDNSDGLADHKEVLLRFGIDPLPGSYRLQNATLGLFFDTSRSVYTEHTVYVRQLMKEWNQGVGSGPDGPAALDGEATWNSARHNQELWEVAGAYGANDITAPSPEVQASFGSVAKTWVTFGGEGLTSTIKAFLLDVFPNYGFKITQNPGNDPAALYTTGMYDFCSSEFSDPTLRPILVMFIDRAPTVTLAPASPITIELCHASDGVELTGTIRDLDGDPVEITWTTTGGTVTPGDPPDTAAATFTALGSYVVTCSATDGILTTTRDVTIDVVACTDTPPSIVLDPAGPLTLELCHATVSQAFTAMVSDPDAGQTLTTTWTNSGGTLTADGTSAGVVYDATGQYTVSATVSDGILTATAEVTVNVIGCTNTAPTIGLEPGGTYVLELCDPTVSQAFAATVGDIDAGQTLTTTWTTTGGTLTPDGTNAGVVFDAVGEYDVTATVSDGIAETGATTHVSVIACTGLPVYTGDANNSKAIDIADAICILGYLFGPETDACKQPKCLANLDTNDSNAVDIADAIRVLSFLFANGDMLAPDASAIVAGGDGCKLYPKPEVTLECAQQCAAK